MENVKKWLNDNGSGDGYGSGYGSGDGYDSGYGDGSGDGSGDGYNYGSGFGSGYAYGYGYGYGSGDDSGYDSGYGDGSGYGYGYGSGSGSNYGLSSFNGNEVYIIDGVQTIITHIKNSFASGYILNSDLTLERCYIAKGRGYFAHGKTIKEARDALQSKIFENMDSDDVIDKFLEEFRKDEKYSGKIFFEWHHYLTGSCLMGRESFVRNHNIDLEDLFTVDDFINICENDYGGSVIKDLKEKWRKLYV